MRSFRKTVFIILALLPCITFILTACHFIGGNLRGTEEATATVTELIASPCHISKTGDSYIVQSQASDIEFTILDKAFLFQTNILGAVNFTSSSLGLLYIFQEAGILITTPMVFSVYYLWYVFVIFLCDFLISFLTFIPRKCSEFLTKGMN